MSAPKLTDFLRGEDLQRMQDAFASATDLSVAIVDEAGGRITKPGNWAGFCGMLAGDKTCAQECRYHIAGMLQYNRESGLPAVTACPHTGLVCAAVPFFFDGLHLGSWVLGQMKLNDGDAPRLEGVVRQMNMPHEAAQRMLARLPARDRAWLDSLLACLAPLNETVLRQGYERQDVENTAQDLWGLSRRLEEDAARLRLLTDVASDGVYVADYATGEVLMANKTFCAQVEQPMEGVLGRRCYQLNCAGMREGFCRKCPRALLLDANGQPNGPHSWTLHAHRQDRWYHCTIRALHWPDGRLVYAVARRDITAAHLRQQRLEQAAYRDRGTGAANIARLLADLEAGCARGPAGSAWLVCFHLAHMDSFVKENGRQAAMVLMRAIAAWVEEQFEQATLYRLEGYGFGLLLTGATRTRAVKLARSLKRRFTQPWQLELATRRMVYNTPVLLALIALDETMNGDALFERIDDGLVCSAQNGGFHIHDSAYQDADPGSAALDSVLVDCVHNGMYGFDVHYQPIVDAATGVWRGLEALCRWSCPRRGAVPPAEFIPRAEALGFMDTLGDWVLHQALKTCQSLHLDQMEDFFLTVNVTPTQMAADGFPERVRQQLALYAYPARKLALEVSECPQVKMNQSAQAAAMLLRRWGVRILMDDFGVEYASFDSLKCLPVSFVKPEQKLLRGIEKDAEARGYIYLMGEIVRANGIHMVAEGVETREQAEIVRSAGVDYMQGFFFARPMPGRDLARRLDGFTKAPGLLQQNPPQNVRIGDLLDDGGGCKVEPELFKLQNQCARLLLEQPSPEAAFEEVLGLLGAHLQASRAFAFVRVSDDYYSCVHHWCGKGVQPVSSGRQCVRLEDGASGVLQAFREDGALVAPNSAALPEADREALGGGGYSLVVFPLWNDGKVAGFMGLCAPEGREWQRSELILLWDLSLFMSESVRRERIRAHTQKKQMVLSQLLNNDGLSIYISDLDTDEILWANDAFKKQHGSMQCVGEKCHMVLHGNARRCSFCKKGELMQCATGGQLVSEKFNEKLQKTLVVSDNLVQWENGRLAHIQYALDVSEQRVARRQLEVMSTTDALTGTANRAVLMQRLEAMLKKAAAGDKPAALAFVDVDRLKTVNDHKGHKEGDRLLCSTVQAIKTAVRKGDVIGRIGGDEFVVLFPGCNRQMADERMQRALEFLQEESGMTFSYGTADNSECAPQEGEGQGAELLRMADERMLQHKRQHVPEKLIRSLQSTALA